MASLPVRREPSTIGEAFSLFKCSARHLRGFSTAASTESSSTAGDAGVKKPKRKKKNVFEVACFLPNWGIGYHMAKTHWNNVSYEITKLNLYKDGRHGKAWGIAHKDGAQSLMRRRRSVVFTNAAGEIFQIRKSQPQGKVRKLLDEMDLLIFTSLQFPL